MKTQKRLILISLMLLGALLLFLAPVAAQATLTEFTDTEVCVPTNPGTWTFPDGNIHVRGMVCSAPTRHQIRVSLVSIPSC